MGSNTTYHCDLCKSPTERAKLQLFAIGPTCTQLSDQVRPEPMEVRRQFVHEVCSSCAQILLGTVITNWPFQKEETDGQD